MTPLVAYYSIRMFLSATSCNNKHLIPGEEPAKLCTGDELQDKARAEVGPLSVSGLPIH